MAPASKSAPRSLWKSPKELIKYLAATYHNSLRRDVRDFEHHADILANQRVASLAEMDRLQREFTAFSELLEAHLAGQEAWLFPIIHDQDCQDRTHDHHLGPTELDGALDEVTTTNTELLACMDRIEQFLRGPHWVEKGSLVTKLREKLHELHRDVRAYARLESDTLVPRLRQTSWLAYNATEACY